MLHILLSILKITGILLLVLLLVLLVLILMVLFVPVRYQADALIHEEKRIHARIHWLFRMFGIDISYADNNLVVQAFLFWFIPIAIIPAKTKKENQVSVEKTKKQSMPSQEKQAMPTHTQIVLNDKQQELTNVSKTSLKKSEEESKEGNNKKVSILSKIKEVILKIWRFPVKLLDKIKYTIRSVYDKITTVKGQLDYYLDLMKKESTKQAFFLCKDELIKIIKHIFPKKISGEFQFGSDDPASTGQIYGIYCAASMIHNNRILLKPDFDRKIMEGWVKIKGRIRGIIFVYAALKIILNKNIRYLIKTLKHKTGGSEHGI